MARCARILAAVAAVSLALAPVSAAYAQSRGELSQTVAPAAAGFDAARLAKLDAYMAKVVADGRVAGMHTLLIRRGKVVANKTYGYQNLETKAPTRQDTIYRIYSMTKPVTGVAMMILFEEGKWRLDDPITWYLPEMKDLKVVTGWDRDGKPIIGPAARPPTMRELMSHTAGFGYGLADEHPVDKMFREKKVLESANLNEMVKRTAEIPLMFQPGTSWSYSIAVDLQGAIVERLSGKPLHQFMDERIFKPLKMTDTGFYVPKGKESRLAALYVYNRDTKKIEEAKEIFSIPVPTYLEAPAADSGGGGLVSTTMDYARFAQMIANKGELDGVRILSPAAVEMMGTNMIPKNVLVSNNGSGVARFNEAIGFGLDFQVVNEPRYAGSLEGKGSMSWGGAAGTWFWVDPTNDIVFVGMIQRMGGTGGPDLGGAARTLTYQALTQPAK